MISVNITAIYRIKMATQAPIRWLFKKLNIEKKNNDFGIPRFLVKDLPFFTRMALWYLTNLPQPILVR